MTDKERGLTYAQAGVDIDAGNRMVDLIKPLVRDTARPGADSEIGGFGGLFDLGLEHVRHQAPSFRGGDGAGAALRSRAWGWSLLSAGCPSRLSVGAWLRCARNASMPG